MKKFYSILAVAAVVVALASCGSKTAESTEAAADSTAVVATPAVDSTATAMPADTAAAMPADTAAKMK